MNDLIPNIGNISRRGRRGAEKRRIPCYMGLGRI